MTKIKLQAVAYLLSSSYMNYLIWVNPDWVVLLGWSLWQTAAMFLLLYADLDDIAQCLLTGGLYGVFLSANQFCQAWTGKFQGHKPSTEVNVE